MSDKPKRRCFRFRLLTLMLMTVAAGGMVQADVVPTKIIVSGEKSGVLLRYGWPFVGLEIITNLSGSVETHYSNISFIGLDAVLTALVLAVVALVSESLIRRREARKP